MTTEKHYRMFLIVLLKTLVTLSYIDMIDRIISNVRALKVVRLLKSLYFFPRLICYLVFFDSAFENNFILCFISKIAQYHIDM